jgi:hypothetical protein
MALCGGSPPRRFLITTHHHFRDRERTPHLQASRPTLPKLFFPSHAVFPLRTLRLCG